MKDPAFLFYSQDFIVGVQFMSWEERGKYITLLCYMHQHGRLSEDQVNKVVGKPSENLRSKFSVDKNGLYFNKRLEEEAKKRSKYVASRRKNGKKGGRPPKNHMDNHMDNHMRNHTENENEDINIPEYEEFKEYALSKEPKIDLKALRFKYEAWIANNWKNGNHQPIKNWKVALLNTLPFLETKKKTINW